jgi:NAD(P)-dependent dehydrogenase (short-subunit alcohol dehydrogenase family)
MPHPFGEATDRSITGRVVLITGSTRGIGRAAASRFAAAGARVVITGRDRVVGEQLALTLQQAGADAICVPADITDEHKVVKMIEQVAEHYGAIDVLVNNAAAIDQLRSGLDNRVDRMDLAAFDKMMNVNLRGAVVLVKHAMPHLIKSQAGGVIVNVSSIAALIGHDGFDAYTAAKGALISLSRAWSVEFAANGVRSNCVVVGLIPHEDDRPTHQKDSGLKRDQMLRVQLVNRHGTTADISNAIAFLASNEQAGFITGQSLVVDGGVLARSPTLLE